jgi:nucleoside-diphosphate-sugar epimerase
LLSLGKQHEIVGTYNSSQAFPRFVEEMGLDVTPVQCDLRSEESVHAALTAHTDFDKCLYLASDTRVGYLTGEPGVDVTNNILPVANFVKNYSGGTVVFFSSGAVYMGNKGLVSPAKPLRPTIPYSISKLAAEEYVQFGGRTRFDGSVIIRFFGAYGPYEPERKITRKLILSLLEAGSKQVEFTVFGDGKNLIDVMHVDDAVDCIRRVLQSRVKDGTYDLCGERSMPINEYVKAVAAALQWKVKILHSGSSPEYIQFHASNRRFVKRFGERRGLSLERGVRAYAKWLTLHAAR